MNIIYNLLYQFVVEEQVNISLMVAFSFIINIFQTNVLSLLTAHIIEEIYDVNKKGVWVYFNYFLGISILYLLLFNVFKYFQNKILTKLRQWIRHHILRVLLLVNNENYHETNFTKLSSPINRISSVCFLAFNDVISYLLPNLSFLIIVSGYFLYKELWFGLTFIFGNILLMLYLFLHWPSMVESNEAYEKHVGETESYMIEILNNIDKIIYRGQVDREIYLFFEKTETSIHHAMNFYSFLNNHGFVMTIIAFVLLFVLLWLLIFFYFQDKIDLTTFLTFFTILLLYRDKISTIIQQIPDFIEFLGRSDAVLKHFKHMDVHYENIAEPTLYLPVALEFLSIRFENVAFKYGSNNTTVFDHFSSTVSTNGTIVGITGLSGKGKSTFAKLLLKMYKPTEGSIYIDEVDIKDIDPIYIRENITYVNQTSKLFDKKIIDNILYGCNDLVICRDHLDEIMKYPKIKELYKNMDINEKQSGSMGENLSGGQRQVINIIGGLINPCKIVILDEPTNALDGELKKEIIRLISAFKQYKHSIIIITHDHDVFPLFDTTVQI